MQQQVAPKAWSPSSSSYLVLRRLYPNINWEKVRFFEGMPWFVGKFAEAIVLPSAYRLDYLDVYLKQAQDDDVESLALLVHEAMHLQQCHEIKGLLGYGYFRKFVVYYLAYYYQVFFAVWREESFKIAREKGYWKHPLELPAYLQERRFKKLLTDHLKAGFPIHETVSTDSFLDQLTQIKVGDSGTTKAPKLWFIVPATLVTLPLLFAAPIVDGALRLAYAVSGKR